MIKGTPDSDAAYRGA